MNRILKIVVALASLLSALPTWANDQEAKKLQQLLDDAWEFRLSEDPLFATQTGDHRFNDRSSQGIILMGLGIFEGVVL